MMSQSLQEKQESIDLITDSNSSTSLLPSSEEQRKRDTYKIGFIITLPVFMGYASCFSLQKKLSVVFGLTEGVSGTHLATVYGLAVSFVYFFNLIFRVFGHNIVFGMLKPRDRVIAALVCCTIGMTALSILSFQKKPPSVAWVFLTYSFVGMCEGSYGPNMLNVVNRLGDTRKYVILAMPTGVATITLLAFLLMALGVPFQAFYIFTACNCIIGIIIYLFTIYPASKKFSDEDANFDLKAFCKDLCEIKSWFPPIWKHSVIFLVNMICLAMFNPGCTLYAYHSRVTYSLFGFTLDNDWFMFLYNFGGFCGDFISRKVMDKKRLIDPIWYFVLLLFAFAMNIVLIPEIAPLAAFGFMWANGGLYAQSTKKIGEIFKEKYHLTATSTWLFIGDAGSTSGSFIIQPIRAQIAKLKSEMF